MHIPKWLIATLGLLLAVLIAAVAFFIGRESARPPAAAIAASAMPQERAAVRDSTPEEPNVPLAEASPAIPSMITASVNGNASSNATTSSASAPSPAAEDHSQATAETRARVAAYFKQMEAIRSGGAIGDQEQFATTIVNGAVSGDFSGIDELLRAASDAERRAAALQPPSECAEYHRLTVTLLQESRTMITALREGLKRNDTGALTSMSVSAQSMKSRAETLAEAERALRARFGL